MRKLKTAAVVLLALLLIIALALLPQGVAGISDQLAHRNAETAAMQTVELALHSARTDEPGYMLRKLALEQRMSTIPIEPEQAAMTQEEVLSAALEGMQAYTEAGVFSWFDYTAFFAEPYLGVDPEDQNNNTVFWGVNFVQEGKPYRNLFLHIDDETGSILYLNYETYGPDAGQYSDPEDQRRMLEGFVDAFFRPLKLSADQMNRYQNFIGAEMYEKATPDEETIAEYSYTDAQYGTICVTFYIFPNGLRVIPGGMRR